MYVSRRDKKQSMFRTLRLVVWNKHHLVRRVVFAVQLAVDARPRHRLEIPAHRMETHLREPNRPPRTRHVGGEPHRAQRRHREVSALVKLLADVERRRSSENYGLTLSEAKRARSNRECECVIGRARVELDG